MNRMYKFFMACLVTLNIFSCNTDTDTRQPPPFMAVRFAPFTIENNLDPKGIPQVNAWCSEGLHYSPTTIAQWGLGGYARNDMALAIKAADWLIAHQISDGSFPIMFDCKYPKNEGPQMTAPWPSAITQGNAIALLVRVFKVTNDSKYRDSAVKALVPLQTTVEKGGLQGRLNGGIWFEEMPDKNHPGHIFNGSVFALLGIHELYLYTGNKQAKTLWEAGEKSLRSNINAHVVWAPHKKGNLPDPWVVYELQVNGLPEMPNYLTDFYMQIHIELIEEMAIRTGAPIYTQMSQIFQKSLAKYLELNKVQ